MNDEKDNGLGAGFFKNRARLEAKNEENKEIVKKWERDAGAKPPREMLPKILSEREIHDKAKAMTANQNEEQKKLHKLGLTQEQQEQQDAILEKIRKRKERERDRPRRRGDTGRTMDR